jgi:hypothetical protein
MANGRDFLGIPSRTGWIWAGVTVIGFMLVASVLYGSVGAKWETFWVKVADLLLQGALVGVLFAILKGVIDNSKGSSS